MGLVHSWASQGQNFLICEQQYLGTHVLQSALNRWPHSDGTGLVKASDEGSDRKK